MAALPPQGKIAFPTGPRPAWTLLGPAPAAVVGLAIFTSVFRLGGASAIQMDLGLSGAGFLVTAILTYVIAAAVAFPLGYLLSSRALTAVSVSAVVVMFLGLLLVALGGGSGMLLVGRVLGGLGTGAAAGATVALLPAMNQARGIATAAVAVPGFLALVIAPVVCGLISDSVSFRVAYLVGVPFLFFALLAAAGVGIASSVSAKRPAPPAYGAIPRQAPGFHP
ncbi:hypothetical protein [Nocardia sp. NPDC024068]|uniref:hypothetical protein n=1 Tax=Nocardia sp. NPDC024068 TaxID=3157197 RepID=UPI0033E17032